MRHLAMHIYQKGNLGERKKADAQRQRQVQQRHRVVAQQIDIADKKIGVFVIAQQCQIASNSSCQNDARLGAIGMSQPARHPVVEQHGAADQPQVGHAPPAVEKQRGKHEPQLSRHGPNPAAQEKVDNHGQRQEKQQVFKRIEQHRTGGKHKVRELVWRGGRHILAFSYLWPDCITPANTV
jgi:hypothetical protein